MFVHNNLAENRNWLKSRFCWTGATTNLCSADFLKLQRHATQIVSGKCWNILNRTFMQFQFTPTSGGTTPIICTTHTPIGRQWHIFEPEDGAAACMWTLRPHSLGILNTYTCTLIHQSIDVPWSIFSAVSIIPVRDDWEQLFWWISEEKKNIYDQIYYPMNIQHDFFNSPAVTAMVNASIARPDLISGDFSSFAKQIPV